MDKYRVEIDNETIRWYKFGTTERHRLDGPAIEYSNGDKFWYQNGERHRLDGHAIEYANGSKLWYQNDKLHRLDGPACEFVDGYKEWYQNDKLHRLDGPAIEYANGNKYWYIEGLEYTEADFLKKTAKVESYAGKVVEIDGQKYKLTPII